jgi:hypothetical protein
VDVQVISTLGCGLERAEGGSVGKKCELYFEWNDVLIGVEAQIIWKDVKGRMGLKFLSVDKDSQKRLSDLCATLSRQPLSTPPTEGAERARPLAGPALPREGVSAPVSPADRRSAAGLPIAGRLAAGERERRRVPRYLSDMTTRLSNLATGASWNVTLVTLSILGACAEGLALPNAGQKCEVATEWEGRTLRVEAEVVWKGKGKVGLEFASLAAEAEQLLRQICATLQLQPLASIPPEPF